MSDHREAREAGARAYAQQLYMGAGGGFRGPQIDSAMEPLMPGVLKDSNGVIDAFLAKLSETHAILPREPTDVMLRAFTSYAVCAGEMESGYRAMIEAATNAAP